MYKQLRLCMCIWIHTHVYMYYTCSYGCFPTVGPPNCRFPCLQTCMHNHLQPTHKLTYLHIHIPTFLFVHTGRRTSAIHRHDICCCFFVLSPPRLKHQLWNLAQQSVWSLLTITVNHHFPLFTLILRLLTTIKNCRLAWTNRSKPSPTNHSAHHPVPGEPIPWRLVAPKISLSGSWVGVLL